MTTAKNGSNGRHEYAEGHSDTHGPSGTYNPTGPLIGQPTVSFPDANASNSGDGLSYSAFQHKMAEIQTALHGILSMGSISDDKEKLLLRKWMRFHGTEWNANCFNREGRIWREQEMIDTIWTKQLGDDSSKGEMDEQIGDVLNRWSQATSLITEVTVQKRLYGLRHVERHRRDVLRAREAQEQARYDAAKLGSAANQIFWCRIRQRQIAFESNMDSALGVQLKDFTAVKLKLAKGESVLNHISDMTYWYQRVADRVFNSLADGDQLRDFFATITTGQWPYDRRAPAPVKRGMLGLGPRGDQEDPEEEQGQYSDYEPRSRGRGNRYNQRGVAKAAKENKKR